MLTKAVGVAFRGLRDYWTAILNLGLWQAALYKIQKSRSRGMRHGEVFELRSRHAAEPLACRAHTSDADAFSQIFVAREFRCFDGIGAAPLIIDCGANVGYASVYFLNRYPTATLIAIEPDPGNFALLQRNVAPYGARCRAICAAVWSKQTGLKFSDVPFGDGREWSRSVTEVSDGQSETIRAVDIGTLLRESGVSRVSILKIDIEGAEVEVFGAPGCREWLPKVDNLAIELHGEHAKQVFYEAVGPERFVISRSDELTVCMRATS